MGRRRQALACGLAAVALGLPSSAWAQGAGDEQYSDPFEDEQEQGGSQDAPEPEETPAPDTSTSSQEPAPAAQEPAPAAPAQAPAAEQLPRTGADADLLALGGTLLLAGGVALRVRVSERSPRRR